MSNYGNLQRDPGFVDTQYEDMMRHVRDHGREKGDRTGTGTTSVFGYQLRYDLQKGFPLVTTKKVATKPMIVELLWFLRGDTNIKYLQENECKIWNEWADDNGNLGPVYGAQWRAWPGQVDVQMTHRAPLREDLKEVMEKQSIPIPGPADPLPFGVTTLVDIVSGDGDVHTVYQKPIDQIEWAINRLKTNPDCRRIIVSAWNVSELPKMKLAPCHCLFQFYTHEMTVDERAKLYTGEGLIGTYPPGGCMNMDEVVTPEEAAANDAWVNEQMHKFLDEQQVPRRALSCQLYQRSCDTFLGIPFNIASYSLLTHMVAQQVGMAVGDFIWTGGDVHLYSNHKEQVETQLARVPEAYPFPTLKILRKPESIFDYRIEDFEFENYLHHPAIKAPVAV